MGSYRGWGDLNRAADHLFTLNAQMLTTHVVILKSKQLPIIVQIYEKRFQTEECCGLPEFRTHLIVQLVFLVQSCTVSVMGLTSESAHPGAYTGNYGLEDDLFGLTVCGMCIKSKTVRAANQQSTVFSLVTLFRSRQPRCSFYDPFICKSIAR